MTNEDTVRFAVAPDRIQIVYADTDTLSSFLNRNSFNYFLKVFEAMDAEVTISKIVLDELYNGKKKELRKYTIERLKQTKRITIEDIEPFSEEDDTYAQLSETMGKGEASALALAKHSKRKAGVASNNMSDVANYAKANQIELWPTGKILRYAVDLEIMNMKQADELWKKMKADGLKLPMYDTFKEYYDKDSI